MRLGDKLRYYLYLGLLYPLALLPMWALYGVSDCLYFLFYKVLKYRIKVVRHNLETSFPEKTSHALRAIERDFYHQLCDNIVETIKLLHISDKQIRRRVVVTNPEEVDRRAKEGKSIMLYLAHYGNWEWVPSITYWYTPDIYSGYIYKAMHDKAADRLMQRVRARIPSHGLEIMRSVREILHESTQNPALIIGFISDHRFNSNDRKFSTPFLNHDTPYYIGAEAIGRKIAADYLFLDTYKPKRGHYRLTFVPISPTDIGDDGPNPITRRYYQLLEQNIRRRPGLWLWSHKRWK